MKYSNFLIMRRYLSCITILFLFAKIPLPSYFFLCPLPTPGSFPLLFSGGTTPPPFFVKWHPASLVLVLHRGWWHQRGWRRWCCNMWVGVDLKSNILRTYLHMKCTHNWSFSICREANMHSSKVCLVVLVG